jgi:REase associating with pPIWI_RE/pPIWI_RE three-gene island domain Y
MKKIARNREKILSVLSEWLRLHNTSPTLEELCEELGMRRNQKATIQRWLQTMRGIDVEWDDHISRSLRLIGVESATPEISIPIHETLRYLATGLVKWEGQQRQNRGKIPESLRLGMSGMYLTSLLQGDETAPANLPELFNLAANPVSEWKPAHALKNLSPTVTWIEEGTVSDFAVQWQVDGGDVEHQVQEKVLQDVLEYCRGHQLVAEYREFRQTIITQPILTYPEYRRLMLSSSPLKPLRDFIPQVYVDLTDLQVATKDVYHFCPRCHYLQSQREGIYRCQSNWCRQLSVEAKLPPLDRMTIDEAENCKAVTPGVYRYGTLPGIWEIQLYHRLKQMGLGVTLWPEIDEYDLLVEFSPKLRWAIDLKDWSYLNEERLFKVKPRTDCQATFVVFPDERERDLRILVRRQDLEPQLNGVKLKLISEIVAAAQALCQR